MPGLEAQTQVEIGQGRLMVTLLPFEQAVQAVPLGGFVAEPSGFFEQDRGSLELACFHALGGLSQEIRRGWVGGHRRQVRAGVIPNALSFFGALSQPNTWTRVHSGSAPLVR